MKLLTFLLVTLLFYSCSRTEKQSDEEAVKRVVLDFQDDFNNGLFKKAENYATADWVHINPRGGIDKGRQNVLKTVRAVHQSFLKGITMTLDSMDIRFVKPDVALVTGYHTMANYITPEGIKHVNQQQIKSYVIIKQSGQWMLTLDHNTIVQRK